MGAISHMGAVTKRCMLFACTHSASSAGNRLRRAVQSIAAGTIIFPPTYTFIE